MKLNVAVIFGGRSVEHEISVLSAHQCINALDKEKYTAIPIYISKQGLWYTGKKLLDLENFRDLDLLVSRCHKIGLSQNVSEHKIYKDYPVIFSKKFLAKIDIAFPVLHGTNCEDGVLQGFFELMNIPYVGCDVLSSAVTMDKVTTKMLMQSMEIPVLKYVWFYSHEWIDSRKAMLAKIKAKLSYPMIVKPANLGSSIGITVVKNQDDLCEAVDLVIGMSKRILIEPLITKVQEVNCAVLGDSSDSEVSVCEEPVRSESILTYQDKYSGGSKLDTANVSSSGMSSAKRIIPAVISRALSKQIQSIAKKAFTALNCCGVVRVDFLINKKDKKVYLCEINTIPGSLSFYLWEPMGKTFTELADRLIELALKRHRESNNLNISYDSNILRGWKNGSKC